MERTTVAVEGLACHACEQSVENAVRALDGVSRVAADHESGAVDVVAAADLADADLHTAIEDAGYDVSG